MDSFNDVGFLSKDLSAVDWVNNVRLEFKSDFELATRFNQLAMRILFAIPTENINDEQALAVASYGRAVQSFQVSILLAERGTLAESRAIFRLCCEAVIAVCALKVVPNTVNLFLAAHDKHNKAVANAILLGGNGEKPEKNHAERLQSVLDGIEDRQGSRKPESIRWNNLAERAGLKSLYDLAYRLPSGDAAHLGLGSMNRHTIADSDNQLAGFKFQPDKSDLASTLFAANASIAHLLKAIVEWFSLDKFTEELELYVLQWKGTSSS